MGRSEAGRRAERSYYERNRALVKERATAWAAANPRRRFAVMLKRRFGIGLAEFDALLLRQVGRCGICDLELDPSSHLRMPHVDHCHATGVVRGILCGACNRALGLFGDDAPRLANAAAYIRGHLWPSITPPLPPRVDRANDRRPAPRQDRRRKLTEEQVSEIRTLLREGATGSEIARRFAITRGHVSNIRQGFR